MGGMGFRNLPVFNQALHAKQVWRLFSNPHSLVCRILKARYFKNSSVLDARRGSDPSFTRRSLWGAKSLLLDGLQWRVGDGNSIKIWEDSWLPGERGGKTPAPNIEVDPSTRVSVLIDAKNGAWNEEALGLLLTEDDASLARSIPLSKRRPVDQMFWWPAKNGEYSVRTGYWLGMRLQVQDVESMGLGFRDGLWRRIWTLKVPPKLCHFLWRACTGTLAVKKNLFRRHSGENELCAFCGEVETELHAVFTCLWTKCFWSDLGFEHIMLEAPCSDFTNRLTWGLQHITSTKRGKFLALIWALWSIRNNRIFEDEPCNPDVVVLGYVNVVTEYQNYAKKVGGRTDIENTIREIKWKLPDVGTIKINSDAALIGEEDVGLGVVGRDSSGKVVLVANKRVRARWNVEWAEARAMLLGVEMASRFGWSSFCLETDAVNVVRGVLKRKDDRTPFGLCINDICTMPFMVNCKSVSHVKREGNTVAHLVARLNTIREEEMVIVNDFPQSVIRLAELDLELILIVPTSGSFHLISLIVFSIIFQVPIAKKKKTLENKGNKVKKLCEV